MKSWRQIELILDGTKHDDGVRLFMDYFELPGQRPQVEFLAKILASFSELPYENISKIIKWNKQWEAGKLLRLPEEVMSEHVDFHLGGTCFSLTFFLQAILTQNGFQCYPVTADMKAGENIHCALVVILNGQKYLTDPGYLLNRPMAMDPQTPRQYRSQHTGIELRFDPKQNRVHLFTFNRSGCKWRYSFADEPCPPKKFLQHWLESFHRNSMHGLCLTKIQKDGLIYIHKNFMRETGVAGKKNYNIRRSYHQTIESVFGIRQELVEKALAALDANMKRERETAHLSASPQMVASR